MVSQAEKEVGLELVLNQVEEEVGEIQVGEEVGEIQQEEEQEVEEEAKQGEGGEAKQGEGGETKDQHLLKRVQWSHMSTQGLQLKLILQWYMTTTTY